MTVTAPNGWFLLWHKINIQLITVSPKVRVLYTGNTQTWFYLFSLNTDKIDFNLQLMVFMFSGFSLEIYFSGLTNTDCWSAWFSSQLLHSINTLDSTSWRQFDRVFFLYIYRRIQEKISIYNSLIKSGLLLKSGHLDRAFNGLIQNCFILSPSR